MYTEKRIQTNAEHARATPNRNADDDDDGAAAAEPGVQICGFDGGFINAICVLLVRNVRVGIQCAMATNPTTGFLVMHMRDVNTHNGACGLRSDIVIERQHII